MNNGLISLKKNFRVKFSIDVILICVMPHGAEKMSFYFLLL